MAANKIERLFYLSGQFINAIFQQHQTFISIMKIHAKIFFFFFRIVYKTTTYYNVTKYIGYIKTKTAIKNVLLVWKTTVMLTLSFIDLRTICYSCITFLSFIIVWVFNYTSNKLWLFCQNLSLFTCYIGIVLYLYVCLTWRLRDEAVHTVSGWGGPTYQQINNTPYFISLSQAFQ